MSKKFKIILITSFTTLVASVVFAASKSFGKSILHSKKENKITESQAILSRMTEMQKISQIFLVNIEGDKKYKAVEFDSDNTPIVPGGVLLFSYNIAPTKEGVIEYTESIRDYCKNNSIPFPYVAVDQEGGDVNRLKSITSPLPSNSLIAQKLSAQDAQKFYSLQAKQMESLGITMNLSPVCESLLETNKDFLETRSYGTQAKTCTYSIASILGYEKNNVAQVAKHFPGNTNTDPHTGLPEINESYIKIERDFLFPFALILRAKPSCVLMSHARVREFDEKNPAALSSFWITDMLRDKMNFKGLVISDDIFMGALNKNGFPPEAAAVMAIKAGTNVIMLSEKKFVSVARILLEKSKSDTELRDKITESEIKVIEFKKAHNVLSESKISKESRLNKFDKAYDEATQMYRRFF